MSTPISLVLTTVSTRQEALELARSMVERRLAACAQINSIESLYHWEGKLHNETEWRVLFKTPQAAQGALAAALRAAHPYELPAIVTLSAQSTLDFAQWVCDEVQH